MNNNSETVWCLKDEEKNYFVIVFKKKKKIE